MSHHFEVLTAIAQLLQACAQSRFLQCDAMMPIDTDWFTNRLAERGLSQRGLAKLMGLDPAAVSLMLRGKRRMTVEEASQLAVLLQSTSTEVLEAAGVPVTGGDRVRVAAILQVSGHVELVAEGLHDTVEAPPGIPVDAMAIQSRTGGLDDGWLYFTSAGHAKPESVLGQLALVAIRDNGLLLAHVRRGYRKGAYNLVDVAGRALQSVELAWASPVFWVRTNTH
jgi:transcriptional regulator with XRE-family HTH domain